MAVRGSGKIIPDADRINGQKHNINPFQLSFGMQPGAIHPDHTKRLADEHGLRVTVTSNRHFAEQDQRMGQPLQLCLKPGKFQQPVCHAR